MATNPVVLPTGAGRIAFDRPAQVRAGLLAAAFIAVFWEMLDFIPPDFGGLVHAWVYEPDWNHGPLIPLFSAYLVYARWERVQRCAIRHAWLGLVVMLGGLGTYVWALSGEMPFAFARPVAMMVTLLGVIILLCGLPVLRQVWLPWLYLFFAIPIPQRMYFAMTDPLRRMAATVAATVLGAIPELGLERVGSNLEYTYRGATGVIGVADACSGMRSTVTLCAGGGGGLHVRATHLAAGDPGPGLRPDRHVLQFHPRDRNVLAARLCGSQVRLRSVSHDARPPGHPAGLRNFQRAGLGAEPVGRGGAGVRGRAPMRPRALAAHVRSWWS